MKKVQILVDRDYTPPGEEGPVYARTSLWKEFLGKLDCSSNLEAKEISICERKKKKPHPEDTRIDEAQVLIVNWDAANGDYVCGSDDVFLYFQTQRDKRDALLRQRRIPPGTAPGGIILCEFQCGSGMLFQGAYDAIFGPDEVKVVEAKLPPEAWPEVKDEQERKLKEENKWTNTRAVVHPGFRKHPLLVALPGGKVESAYGNNNRRLFNFNEKEQQHFFSYRHRDTIYRGWFERWGKEWVPLLIAEPREKWGFRRQLFNPPPAVLLAKCYEGGLMLASTMWLAVPGAEGLIARILAVKTNEVVDAHKSYFCRRRITDGLLFFVTAALFLGVMACLVGIAIWIDRHWIGWGLNIDAYLNGKPLDWGLSARAYLDKHIRWISFIWHFLHDNFPFAAGSVAEDVGSVWSLLIAYRFWQSMIRDRPHGVKILQYAKFGITAFWDRM